MITAGTSGGCSYAVSASEIEPILAASDDARRVSTGACDVPR